MFDGLVHSRPLIFESSDQSGNEGIITARAAFDTGQEAIEGDRSCYVVSTCRRRQKQRSGQRRWSR